ncbi:MAG: hypothetical protein AAFX05_03345 [Planctomycetota bacterium]
MSHDNDPMREAPAEEQALLHALQFLAGEREGILAFDDNHIPIKFITDNETGRLIAPVPVATFFSGEHVLFVPDESDDALQLLISPQEIEESAMTDRWLAYHVEAEHVRWADIYIDSARHGPWVFDGDALTTPNPLRADESRLVKRINEHTQALADLCQAAMEMDVEDPVCVGIVPHGIYVRARFGIIMIAFETTCETAEQVEHVIESLLDNA